MSNERESEYTKFYKKLLALYPRAFRERFAESMEQTFEDLCNERSEGSKGNLLGLTLRVSVNTGTGIIKEHLLDFAQRSTMSDTFTNLRSAAIISFTLVLPFMILEMVNRRNLPESFPVALFCFMWILAMVFIVILLPILQNLRAGNSMKAHPISLLFKFVFLTFIAMMWGYNLYDQLPCFLGVPNCD